MLDASEQCLIPSNSDGAAPVWTALRQSRFRYVGNHPGPGATRRPQVRRYHGGGYVLETGGVLPRDDDPMGALRDFTRDANRAALSSAPASGDASHRPISLSVTVPYTAVSLDPRSHKQLLREEALTIADIVSREIDKGHRLSAQVGQRRGF